MKKLTYLLSVAGLLGLFQETVPLTAQTGPERFYNVESYKANITLTFNYNLTESESDSGYEHSFVISQKFQHSFTTTPGEISTVDMFQLERGDKGDDKAHKGDIMEGVDMDAVSQAMKNSGLDPSVMYELKKTKRETQSYNMGFDKYKTWMTNAVSGGVVSSELFTNFSEKESGSIHCGEGSGLGSFKSNKDYNGHENTSPGKPNLLNPNSFVLLINIDNNTYSFSSTTEFPRGSKFIGNSNYYSSCGTTRKESIEPMAHSYFTINEKKGWIYKHPLPESGLFFSGSDIITDESSLSGLVNLEEGAKWTVKIDWYISPADM